MNGVPPLVFRGSLGRSGMLLLRLEEEPTDEWIAPPGARGGA